MSQSGDSPIFLIGYRGTGKSSVARELAARLGYDWTDADDIVEQEAGKTIAEIFADEGERSFRDMEAQCRRARSAASGMSVVALGGGAVLREENRRAISAAGPVVWLTASVDTILDRLEVDPIHSQSPAQSDGHRRAGRDRGRFGGADADLPPVCYACRGYRGQDSRGSRG